MIIARMRTSFEDKQMSSMRKRQRLICIRSSCESPRKLKDQGHLWGRHERSHSLGSAEKLGQNAEPLLHKTKEILISNPKRRHNVTIAILWVLSLGLTSICTFAFSNKPLSDGPFGSFSTGYMTELRNARPAIRVQKQPFYGSLDFKDRHGFIPPGSPSLKYVGASSEVDAAWDELTEGRYFLLTDQEAQEAYGNEPSKYWNVHHGGYVAGLDVLHTLHCLNHLRMSLYPDYYPQDPEHGQIHKAHCVDHLRQLAMCHADLTPVPTQYFVGLSRNYINSSREHTCRDFSRVREWASERFNGRTAVKPRNRDGTPRENFYAPWDP